MPDPIHKGRLSEISFGKVYYAIAGAGRTGVLDIVDEADDMIRKRLYFLGGDSSFVKFGPLDESLGQILRRKSLISEDQLDEAIEEVALDQKQLGQVLVGKGWISAEKLHEILITQAEMKLVSCFGYQDGRFQFVEESVSQFNHDVPMYKVNPDWVLYQGVMNHYSLDRLEKEFEHFKDKGIRLSRVFEKRVKNFRFLPEEATFLQSIGEGRPFGPMVGGSELGLTRTLKVLYSLLVAGLLEVAEVKSLKSVKVEDKGGLRKKTKTIELPEVEDVKSELAKAALAAVGDNGGDGDEVDFASIVGDYLTETIEREDREKGPAKGELVQYEEKTRELEVRPISDILMDNKKEAMEAYLARGKSGGGTARLGELLIQNKLIDGNQLSAALSKMRERNTSFLTALADIGAVADEDLHSFLSEHFKVPAVKLSELDLDQEIVSLIPQELAKKHRVIPINRAGATIVVAMADPSNIEILDELKFLTGYNIEAVVATEHEIKVAIDRYHDSSDLIDDVMATFDDSEIETATYQDDFDISSVEADVQAKPVVKLVNQVMIDAIGKGASDIHFEPYETDFRIRYRIDGVLYEMYRPSTKLKAAVVSRVKILANLNIAERRLPQDGRISLKFKKKKIDFRVSTLPTLWGEKLVLRILDKESLELDLTKLGMEVEQLADLRWCLHQPYGMVLVTGPSGCGKTTTLYSALLELNKIQDNVSTAEDPVEYYLEGINQVQMHDEIGLNFAYALRSFLRQDPDIIMVGEIRDFETAEIAVKAALTGHLVLSTVHTNDAPSTVNRLLNMGVEPFLITASVNGIMSQRLVRKLCEQCRTPEKVDPAILLKVGVTPEEVEKYTPYKAVGCPNCSDRGYKGRVGLYEVLTLKGDLAELVLAGATPSELKREAMRRGMRTMRQSGIAKAKVGLTTLGEITRSTMPDFMVGSSTFEDV